MDTAKCIGLELGIVFGFALKSYAIGIAIGAPHGLLGQARQ